MPLRDASAVLRANRDAMLAAVQTNGWAFKYVSAELRADREFVLAAVGGMATRSSTPPLSCDQIASSCWRQCKEVVW